MKPQDVLSNSITRLSHSKRRLSNIVQQGLGQQAPQLGFAAAHLRASDIQHVNTGAKVLEFVHRVVYGPPSIVLLFFLVLYVLAILLFACLLYAQGESCYRLDSSGEFEFAAMMWISVHSFSTIGFGGLAPVQSCTRGQLVILLESFVSLLVVSAIGGYVVKMFMRPLSSVRFSKVVLVNHGRRRVAVSDDDEESIGSKREEANECAPKATAGEAPPTAPPTAPAGRRLSFSKTVDQQEADKEAPSRPPSHERTAAALGAAEEGQTNLGGAGAGLIAPALPSGLRRTAGGRRKERRLSHTAGIYEASVSKGLPSYKFVTFRMVRQGRVQLRDVRVQMQAQYWVAGQTAFGDRDSHKGRVVSLTLEQAYFTTLEQLQVWHMINEESPLWRMRDCLREHVDGIEVSVSAFDMASLQQVMFFKRYDKPDLIEGCCFENTLTESNKGGHQQLLADHSKLDSHANEDLQAFGLLDRMASSRGKRTMKKLSDDLAGSFSRFSQRSNTPDPSDAASSERGEEQSDSTRRRGTREWSFSCASRKRIPTSDVAPASDRSAKIEQPPRTAEVGLQIV